MPPKRDDSGTTDGKGAEDRVNQLEEKMDKMMQNMMTMLQSIQQKQSEVASTSAPPPLSSSSMKREEGGAGGVGDAAVLATFRPKMQKFAGEKSETVQTWLNGITNQKKTLGWSDKVAITYAGMGMVDTAAEWFSNYEISGKSWEEFCKEVVQRFTIRVCPHLVPALTGEYRPKIKQGNNEKCDDFLSRVKRELAYMNISHAHWICSVFVLGLRPEVQTYVKLGMGDEELPIDKILKLAIHGEVAGIRSVSDSRRESQSVSPSGSFGNSSGSRYGMGARRVQSTPRSCDVCGERFFGSWPEHAKASTHAGHAAAAHSYNVKRASSTSSTTSNSDAPVHSDVIICYACGEAGHVATRCPNRKKEEVVTSRSSNTVSTNKHSIRLVHGHSSDSESDSESDPTTNQQDEHDGYLTQKKKGKKKSVKAMRLSVRAVSKDGGVGIFSFVGDIYGKRVPCTIDTGADSVSCMHVSVYDALPASIQAHLSTTEDVIMNADGLEMQVKGRLYVPFRLTDAHGATREVDVNMYVVNHIDVRCIIGTDFLLPYTYQLKYKNTEAMGRLYMMDEGQIPVMVKRDTDGHDDDASKVNVPAGGLRHTVKLMTNGSTGPPLNNQVTHKHAASHEHRDTEEEEKKRSADVKEVLMLDIDEHMSNEHEHGVLGKRQKQAMREMLYDYTHLFDNRNPGTARLKGKQVHHNIYTTGHPTRSKPYRHSKVVREYIDKHIQEWLQDGTIVPSSSEYASPVVVVGKKDEVENMRVCIDYRRLNQQSVKDAFPLPNIEDMLYKLNGAVVFTKLDLKSAYHQISIAPEHRHKTAFIHNDGLYEFVRMPFGLCNAPATFQRYMFMCVLGITNCMPYMDDILIFSHDIKNHVEDVRRVLQRFSENGLRLKLKKCQFGLSSVKYLGHVVSKDGIQVNPEKVECVLAMSAPKNVKMLQSFLGLCNYYNKFIPSYAKICKPFFHLLRKGVSYVWSDECEQAFVTMKQRLTSAPVLMTPDFSKPFTIHTDASMDGVGAILSQKDDNGHEHPIIYISRALKPAEKNYHTTHQELLAVMFALKKFRPYILGQKINIFTDHQPLVHIRDTKEMSGRLARWLLYMEPYTTNGNLAIIYKPGKKNANADALSRLVCMLGKVSRHTRAGRQARMSESKREQKEDIMNESKIESKREEEAMVDDGDDVTELSDDVTDAPPSLELSMNDKRIIAMQQCDPMWKHIYMYVSKQICPDEYDEKKRLHLREMCMQYMLVNGQLYHIYMMNNKQQEENTILQLCLPRGMVQDVLTELHDEHGHQSTYKTYVKVMHRYYWMGMYQDIHKHCIACEACIKRKTPHHTSPVPMLSPQRDMMRVHGPSECLALDVVGPLTLSKNRKTAILTVVDHYTRWAAAYALSTATTKNIVRMLVREWMCTIGMPRVLMNDNGSVFTSHVMKKVCAMLSVKQRFVLPYSPGSNGINERFNGTLVNMIATNIKDDQRQWDEYLPHAVFAYNTSVHPATGFTPYKLMHGREAVIGSESVLVRKEQAETTHAYPLYVQAIQHNLAYAHAHVKDRVERQADERDKINAAYKKQAVYGVGDVVYIRTVPRSIKAEGLSKKLMSPYEGPYLVTRQYNAVSYQVKHKHTGKYKKVHMSMMKRVRVAASGSGQLDGDGGSVRDSTHDQGADAGRESKTSSSIPVLVSIPVDDSHVSDADDIEDEEDMEESELDEEVDELEDGEVRMEEYMRGINRQMDEKSTTA
jgi:RNase H-like domain found in reverse transcriptase/Reverse transcriptase (RNA-dependent DNA polymerase)/Integrase zinc binding domain/Integrase core domain/Zinc knuckle